MKHDNNHDHTTEHEIDFIRRLGTHRERQVLGFQELLRRYETGIARRSEWGDIDGDAVRKEIWRLKK